MPRETEKPTRRAGDRHYDYIEEHPAYALIGASRTHGETYLYGTEFEHHNTIRIRIQRSDLRRGLSNDYHAGGKQLIEVELSAAQWARFLTELNAGEGVPCTLRAINGQQVPDVAPPESKVDRFSVEAEQHLADVFKELRELRELLNDTKMSNTARDALRDKISMAEMQCGPNFQFVAKQFAKHVETVTEHAKIEIEAHVQSTLARRGIDGPAPIALGPVIDVGGER
jgi:hypothetical protein